MKEDKLTLLIQSFWLDWELRSKLAILKSTHEAYQRYNESKIQGGKMRWETRNAEFDAKIARLNAQDSL